MIDFPPKTNIAESTRNKSNKSSELTRTLLNPSFEISANG
jgi:hypothetical protein